MLAADVSAYTAALETCLNILRSLGKSPDIVNMQNAMKKHRAVLISMDGTMVVELEDLATHAPARIAAKSESEMLAMLPDEAKKVSVVEVPRVELLLTTTYYYLLLLTTTSYYLLLLTTTYYYLLLTTTYYYFLLPTSYCFLLLPTTTYYYYYYYYYYYHLLPTTT